jgi:hypothetical protein
MPIRVEFYGIARQRAGRSHFEIAPAGPQTTLGQVLMQIGDALPGFGSECLADGRLQASLAANLDGQRFVSDPATPVGEGQCLLILSADAGG